MWWVLTAFALAVVIIFWMIHRFINNLFDVIK